MELDGRIEVASLYSAVNNFKIVQLEIAEPDDRTHENDEPPYEDVEDPKYLEDEYKLAYPPNPKFLASYNYYLSHVACVWTVNENDPADDYDKFAKSPEQFQHIMLATAGCIMIGDSVVLDKLQMNITPVNVRVMIESQIDRENTHQIFYSKWCDVSSRGPEYRTLAFRREYMGDFEKIVEKYKHHNDIQTTLFFIMMCENIMFSPMFLTINYCATLGYAPKICNSNLLVMRDEFIHYAHTRELLASFRRKIKISLARQILDEFVDITLAVYKKIIGDYDDGVFNYEHVRQHVCHIVHMFKLENSLYLTEEERWQNAKLYGKTPAASYMSLPKAETKVNLMESVSTTYKVKNISSGTVNMEF